MSTTPAAIVQGFIDWTMQLKPVRVFTRYGAQGGPVLAAGMTYNALFALFAAIWLGFSTLALIVAGDDELLARVADWLGETVPGLFSGPEGGAVDPQQLADLPSSVSWTNIVASVALLFTLFGWLGSTRMAIRTLLGLPPQVERNPVLGYAIDLGLLLLLGLTMLVGAAASAVPAFAATLFAEALGVSGDDSGVWFTASMVGLTVSLLADWAVLLVLFGPVARSQLPLDLRLTRTLGGAVAVTAIKALGGLLVGNVNNPLLAGFAALIGVLVWINLLNQVILITACWLGVTANDRSARDVHGTPTRVPFWGGVSLPELIRRAGQD